MAARFDSIVGDHEPEEKYSAEIAGLPDQVKPIVITLAQFQNREPVDRICPFCGTLTNVEGKAPKCGEPAWDSLNRDGDEIPFPDWHTTFFGP